MDIGIINKLNKTSKSNSQLRFDKEDWYKNLKKSKLTPPDYVFGIVWSFLYILMFIAFLLVVLEMKKPDYDKNLINLSVVFFLIQLFFNLSWTTLFFSLKKPKLALFDIALTIIFTGITIYYFYQVNYIAAYLLIPYFLWISFASYLNLYIVIKN